MGHTEDELRKCLNNPTLEMLYNASCANYKGFVKSTTTLYSEFIAKFLLDQGGFEEKLRKACKKYRRETKPQINPKRGSPLKDKAKFNERDLVRFWKKTPGVVLGDLGTPIDYEVPLKEKKSEPIGKIDLITGAGDTIYLVEVKYNNNDDNLLRTILEIATYRRSFNENGFLAQCSNDNTYKNIVSTLLIDSASTASRELCECMHGSRPKVLELARALGVEFRGYSFDSAQKKTTIEFVYR